MEELPFIIAVSGPTNAGKTYFSNQLLRTAEEQGISCSRISTDSFYRDLSHISLEERTGINYDAPASIDTGAFIDTIQKLRMNQTVEIPVYDFSVHNRTGGTETILPHDIILVEGIFSFSFDEVLDAYSILVYVDLDPDLRLIRRVKRDRSERGRSIESIFSQYLNTVRPTQEEYVRRDKSKADILLQGDHEHDKVINLLISFVNYLKIQN